MDLLEIVVDCLGRHGLDNQPGVIAISGGPDSVALAHACVGLLREGRLPRLVLGHVNHLLRGEESDADERFVEQLPKVWQMAGDARLVCRTTRIDVARIAEAERDNLESVARRERYAWLTGLAGEEKAAWVATGHTADDQAETVLFRLLRGSGVTGLAGMAECRPLSASVVLVRPLLTVRRQVLLQHLHQSKITYRSDSSNLDLGFTRNRLRLELLPLLAAHYNPGVVDVLCNLAEQARELASNIERQAQALLEQTELPRAATMLVFANARLLDADPNLVREMFRLVWQREGWPMGDMDFARWNWLVEISRGTQPGRDFPGKIHVKRVGNVLQAAPASPAKSV